MSAPISHIAHECDFSCLRYFQRRSPVSSGDVPISTVVNLSEVFGGQKETQEFVIRYLKTTHCDLFFADAAILVEGPAERILVPHFIRKHFPILTQCYTTLLEIGGSHAHRLRPLIEKLGLITLVIADSVHATESVGKSAIQPVRNQGLVTRNITLKTWLPKQDLIDKLRFNASDSDKVNKNVRVAYQHPVIVEIDGTTGEALSNTFEDSLVFENLSTFITLKGEGMIKKFKEAISKHKTSTELGGAMFEILKEGNKAEFALDLLEIQESKDLKVPTYISKGLTWLQEQLEKKQFEKFVPVEVLTPKVVIEANV